MTYNDREGNAKIVHQAPVSSQFLLVTKLRQDFSILLLDRRHTSGESILRFWRHGCESSMAFLLVFDVGVGVGVGVGG